MISRGRRCKGRPPRAPSLSARPLGSKGFEGEHGEGLMHPCRPSFDICNDAHDKLDERQLFGNDKEEELRYCVALRGVSLTQTVKLVADEADASNRSRTKSLSAGVGLLQAQEILATRQNIIRAACVLRPRS